MLIGGTGHLDIVGFFCINTPMMCIIIAAQSNFVLEDQISKFKFDWSIWLATFLDLFTELLPLIDYYVILSLYVVMGTPGYYTISAKEMNNRSSGCLEQSLARPHSWCHLA